MSDKFLGALRRDAACGLQAILKKDTVFVNVPGRVATASPLPLKQEQFPPPRTVKVALHLRRGDLYSSPKLIKERVVDDIYYFEVPRTDSNVLPDNIRLFTLASRTCRC
jgi:hypothetical protein